MLDKRDQEIALEIVDVLLSKKDMTEQRAQAILSFSIKTFPGLYKITKLCDMSLNKMKSKIN